jgi:formylglycine-generating enzyme required for sulfatase activity
MTMIKELLEDVTAFARLGIEERKSLGRSIAAALGDGWSADDPAEDLDALPLAHQPTGLSFVVVPGGAFEMGLTEDDLAELRTTMGEAWDDDIAASLERDAARLRPVRRVQVRPFLVARGYLQAQEVERLSGGRFQGDYCYRLGWGDARQLAASHGFRLASEAELEWLARDGGRSRFTLDAARKLEEIEGDSELLRSRFGVLDLFETQWAEDDYHPSYEGAPDTSVPWMNGAGTGVARGLSRPEYVEEPHQITGLLAALRTNETQKEACVRFARDLPSRGGGRP